MVGSKELNDIILYENMDVKVLTSSNWQNMTLIYRFIT